MLYSQPYSFGSAYKICARAKSLHAPIFHMAPTNETCQQENQSETLQKACKTFSLALMARQNHVWNSAARAENMIPRAFIVFIERALRAMTSGSKRKLGTSS